MKKEEKNYAIIRMAQKAKICMIDDGWEENKVLKTVCLNHMNHRN